MTTTPHGAPDPASRTASTQAAPLPPLTPASREDASRSALPAGPGDVWEYALDLPLREEACAVARRAVRDTLTGWDLRDADLRYDASLVVSELVGNAVRHGGQRVRLELALSPDVLLVAVADGSSVLPHVPDADEAREGGRGMAIVTAVASAWGVEERAPGKRVWAHLPVTGRQA